MTAVHLPAGERPVFIVGSGRSGTTILDRSVGQHSAFASFPFEPQLISRSDQTFGLYQLLELSPPDLAKIRNKLAAYLHSRYAFESRGSQFGFNGWVEPAVYKAAIDELLNDVHDTLEVRQRIRAFLDTLYEPYVRKVQAAEWVDGGPVNGRFIPQIISIYPKAQFIHIIRDGRDVAKSFVRLGWCGGSYSAAVQFWHSQVEIARRLGRYFARGRYMEIDFRVMVERTEETMRGLAHFLAVDFQMPMMSLVSAQRARLRTVTHTPSETRYVSIVAKELCEEFGWF